jgi:hypothetical protein
MSFADLWTEASRDITDENRVRALEMAKHASQGVWAFLALAEHPVEYNDRLELVHANIEAVASATGADLEDVLAIFEQRFALLMEAKGKPFGDDDKDKDDKDEDGDGSTDDDGKDGDKGDETDSGGDEDDDDDSDTDEDGKTDHDKDPDNDGDDDDVDDDGSDGTPPFPPKDNSSRYASLRARIEAGENPLNWGGGPFVPSSVRTAAGATDDIVSDSNVPNPGTPADGLVGGAGPALPETTKPRQTPDGGGMMPGMGDDPMGGGEGLDPALNGGDIQAGADDTPPDSQREAKVRTIASEVQRFNPQLSAKQCRRVAIQAVARYFKQAEDISPLLYGDRGSVADGPLTDKAKSWEPPSPGGSGGSSSGGGGGGSSSGGAGAAGAAEEGAAGAAEGAEGAEALAPLLLL